MDISKVVDCNPHNLFMAYSYGFYITFVYSCLKRRKQNVKIDNVLSPFQPLISGVLQGSILGLTYFLTT